MPSTSEKRFEELSTLSYSVEPSKTPAARNPLALAVSAAALVGPGQLVYAQDEERIGLEEVVVTARKRAESLQDISASIQAFTGDQLERQGLQNIEDVVRFIPSVSHIGGTAGANKIIFRGVSDNPGAFIAASSAALYIDEQPLTQFSINPEPRMIDIERVEALSGPQGTLYGDSSQSGTLRIITNKPNSEEFSARFEGMVMDGDDSSVSNEFNAVVNIPLIEDKLAVRLVGFSALDGGYIDNVFGVSPMRGTRNNAAMVDDDINEVTHTGFRVSARWHINDNWTATLSGIQQESEADNRNNYNPAVGDLQTVKFFSDFRDDKWTQGALTLEGTFGEFEFVSVTSYFDREIDYQFDRTGYSAYFNYNFCTADYNYYCWSGTTVENQDTIGFNTLDQSNRRLTQEFRLSQTTDDYRWVIGAFYEEKFENWVYRAQTPEFLDSLSFQTWTTAYAAAADLDPSWWLSADNSEWDQWAVFGNFSYNFNEQWSAEVGLRFFEIEQDRIYLVDKPFIDAAGWPDRIQRTGGNDDVVPKASVTYRFDDDRMMYALYSKGFRAGGINRNRTPFTSFPAAFEPDELSNYEIGAKTRWLDGRLQVNATAFFMTWEDYQIEVVDPSFSPCDPGEDPEEDFCDQPFQVVVANVGDAEQTGLEIDVQAVLNERWEIGGNALILEAETSEDFELTTLVTKGSRLPNVPELKFNAYAQYTMPLNWLGDSEFYARLQYSYQSDSKNQLEEFAEGENPGSPFRIQPSYSLTDIKVGVANETWEVQAFLNNVTDERAILFDDPGFLGNFFGIERVNVNRPREIGLRFVYNIN